jgi:hypothetical protein
LKICTGGRGACRSAFDIEGGCEDETCPAQRQSFIRYRLVPRYLPDMTGRDQFILFGGTRESFRHRAHGTRGALHPVPI